MGKTIRAQSPFSNESTLMIIFQAESSAKHFTEGWIFSKKFAHPTISIIKPICKHLTLYIIYRPCPGFGQERTQE